MISLSGIDARPVESHSGARENIIAGPYHPPPHSVCVEIETKKRGEGCPLTIRLGVRGSVVSSPSAEPRPKMDFMHILGLKEAIRNTIFSIFERRRGPPNVAGPGKTFPPSPLSTGLIDAGGSRYILYNICNIYIVWAYLL